MKRVCVMGLLSLVLAIPASADVTIKMAVSGTGMGRSGKSTGTTYIKGNKMRSEIQVGDRTQVTVFDLDAQKMFIFEVGKKEADVWDVGEFSKQIGTSVDTANLKASIKPNGQTKQFGSHTANGYDMEISVPATIGGNKEMSMTVNLSGPVWIVKNAPGASDYTNFYKAAAEKGFIFGDPRAAKAQPGQAKAMAEMYKQFADIGGLAYESTVNIKMGGGGGLLGGMMSKLGNMSSTSVVEDVQTGPLADDLFAPPAGARLNTRK